MQKNREGGDSDGRKRRSILLRRVLPLRLIKDISSRLLGLVLQIQIRS